MAKLNKDFKNEVNTTIREIDYVNRKVLFRIIVIVLIVSILTTIGGIYYKRVKVETDREAFKNSTTYTEAAAAFLADSYQEYNNTDDNAEKHAIMQYVIMRYPNLDLNDIQNQTLRQFYNKCLVGG